MRTQQQAGSRVGAGQTGLFSSAEGSPKGRIRTHVSGAPAVHGARCARSAGSALTLNNELSACHSRSRVPSVLLVSTYDMGRQPFGLASPAAWLIDAGADVVCVDLAKERLLDDVVRRSDVVAFFLPMHTATRLALPVIDRVRALNPGCAAGGLWAVCPFERRAPSCSRDHGGPRRRVRGRSGARVHGRAERRGHADDCRWFSDDGRRDRCSWRNREAGRRSRVFTSACRSARAFCR